MRFKRHLNNTLEAEAISKKIKLCVGGKKAPLKSKKSY
jgi:hypothetical protein